MSETTLPPPVSCAITASKSAILPLPASLSRPPPAFVCPQPIASSVKNGSLMHLEGDETFIAGLFLFFSFFITAWREPASIFQWRCLPTVCQCGCFLQRFLMATSVDKLPQSEGRGTEQEQRLHFKIRLRTNT